MALNTHPALRIICCNLDWAIDSWALHGAIAAPFEEIGMTGLLGLRQMLAHFPLAGPGAISQEGEGAFIGATNPVHSLSLDDMKRDGDTLRRINDAYDRLQRLDNNDNHNNHNNDNNNDNVNDDATPQ